MKNKIRNLILHHQIKRRVRSYNDNQLNGYYVTLLRQKRVYPKWYYDLAIKLTLKEKARRDKSKLSKTRVCGSR